MFEIWSDEYLKGYSCRIDKQFDTVEEASDYFNSHSVQVVKELGTTNLVIVESETLVKITYLQPRVFW